MLRKLLFAVLVSLCSLPAFASTWECTIKIGSGVLYTGDGNDGMSSLPGSAEACLWAAWGTNGQDGACIPEVAYLASHGNPGFTCYPNPLYAGTPDHPNANVCPDGACVAGSTSMCVSNSAGNCATYMAGTARILTNGMVSSGLTIGGGPYAVNEYFDGPVDTYETVQVTLPFTGTGNPVNIAVTGEDFLGAYSDFAFTANPVIVDANHNVITPGGSCLGHVSPWCYYRSRYNLQESKVASAPIGTVNGERYTITVYGQFTNNVSPGTIKTLQVQLW